MFTDVVGYSRMMEADELQTFQQMVQLRRLMDDVHEKYHGDLKEFIGDGSLSTFDNPEEAVKAAIELKKVVPVYLGFHLRIGLHYGAIMQQGSDTAGHAINLAARIEDCAANDSIYLSRPLLDQLPTADRYRVIRQGRFRFKNVKERLELFSIETISETAVAEERLTSSFLTRWSSFVSGIALAFSLLMGATTEHQPRGNQKCYTSCCVEQTVTNAAPCEVELKSNTSNRVEFEPCGTLPQT